jgi:cytochrome c oxidase subunit 3
MIKNEVKIKKIIGSVESHPYHLSNESPWPFALSMALLSLVMAVCLRFHGDLNIWITIKRSLYLVLFCCFCWWRDVVRESTFEGNHTEIVQQGLRYGMILFITSEVMFFFAFFWAFFHSSLSPAIQIGGIWPPLGIHTLSAWDLPLFNTMILLLSGASVTWAHHGLLYGERQEMAKGLTMTIALGILFTLIQLFEYINATFKISDGIYGSTFYLATGFHGLHVIIGTLFLYVCMLRHMWYHFTREHHFGFEAACWYWHFVDVVWLFLFISIYFWSDA